MANTAHLVRRQSSRDLNPQRSLDRVEMKEMRGRLVLENGSNSCSNYGATNQGFDDTSPGAKVPSSSYFCSSLQIKAKLDLSFSELAFVENPTICRLRVPLEVTVTFHPILIEQIEIQIEIRHFCIVMYCFILLHLLTFSHEILHKLPADELEVSQLCTHQFRFHDSCLTAHKISGLKLLQL